MIKTTIENTFICKSYLKLFFAQKLKTGSKIAEKVELLTFYDAVKNAAMSKRLSIFSTNSLGERKMVQ